VDEAEKLPVVDRVLERTYTFAAASFTASIDVEKGLTAMYRRIGMNPDPATTRTDESELPPLCGRGAAAAASVRPRRRLTARPSDSCTYAECVDDGWEARMAARANGRAEERIAQRRRGLPPDRDEHIGHHFHRTLAGTECSCGSDFEDACYVGADETQAWWDLQRCRVCGRPGVVLDGEAY